MKQMEIPGHVKNHSKPGPDEIKSLVANLGSKDAIVRGNAHRSLADVGKAAVRQLAEALSNQNERVRSEAGKILDEIAVDWSSYDDGQTISSLIQALGSSDGMARVTARQVLVSMRKRAVTPLKEALLSKDQRRRWEAAKALGQIGDPEATDALIRALEDDMFDVRWLAAEGLIAIGDKAIVPLLEALVKKPDSLWLREGAHHFLHGIDMGNMGKTLLPVRQALEDVEAHLQVPFTVHTALLALTGRSRKS